MRVGAREKTVKRQMNGRCNAAHTSAFCMARLAAVKTATKCKKLLRAEIKIK